jgi:pyruvate/2-oxoglutarate dehydrogenase complex dihydrolipoamide dehydrogenase (E3) component
LVLADFLAARGREVTVLHTGRHFGEEMSSNDRFYLRERLKKAGVTLYKQVVVKSFLEDGVCFAGETGEVVLTAFETVVLADGFAPLREAANLLKARGIQSHFIGDAKVPRHLMYAVAEGEELGREL